MDLLITPDTDWEAAVSQLAAENLTRNRARGRPASPAASQVFAVRRLDVAFRAARLGHAVTWDPPAGLTSVSARWTCTRCGRAVLVRDGQVYGGATTPCQS